jgi:hypothetical protein
MTVSDIMYDMYPEDYIQIVDKDEDTVLEGTVLDLSGNQYGDTRIRFIRPILRQIATPGAPPLSCPAFRICIDRYGPLPSLNNTETT